MTAATTTYDFTRELSWSRVERFALRFLIAYFVLYTPVVLSSLGFLGLPAHWYDVVWRAPASVVASILGFDIAGATRPNAAGDSFEAALVIIFIAIAAAVATIWISKDQATDDRKLFHWLRIGLRYLLACGAIHYGIIALVRYQFTALRPEDLVTPVGQWEPMELLWIFFGWSWIFTAVLAIVELVAGALLLKRETTLAGVLLIGIVLSNVVILNIFFDVPDKGLSVHFTVITALLVLPDAKRFLWMHILDRPVPPADLGHDVPLPAWASGRRTLLKRVVIALFIISPLIVVKSARGFILYPSAHSFAGLYTVKQFTRDGEQMPQYVGDSIPWRRAVVSEDGKIFHVQRSDNAWVAYSFVVDSASNRITLTNETPSEWRKRREWTGGLVKENPQATSGVLQYKRFPGNRLELSGQLGGHQLIVLLEQVDVSKYPFFGD
jgi:hypothetical protein